MRYWVTSHWPHRSCDDPNSIHEGVYVPDGRESAVTNMHENDLVFIYEARSGRPERRRLMNGQIELMPCHQGKEGIVALARIESNIYKFEESEPTEYADGTKIWWRYGADTATVNSHGFVPRDKMNEILGYERNFTLRGFGDMHSGVKEITEYEYLLLLSAFNSHCSDEIENLRRGTQTRRNNERNSAGGEGDTHKLMKERIADDPGGILMETGLRLIKKEYKFITNDRVDILLEDKYGRLVVVEVEPDCAPGNEIGPAQCMKYRSLIAFETNREINEIRMILAAQTIADDIAAKSKRFSIEPRLINLA